MAKVGGKNTMPEMAVRRMLHAMGYRFRIHRRDLPGTPDIVFVGRRKVIEVRGCWWHRHPDPACPNVATPKTRPEFWAAKFTANIERDSRNEAALAARRWSLLVIWECEVRRGDDLAPRLRGFLGEVRAGRNREAHRAKAGFGCQPEWRRIVGRREWTHMPGR
jgi:DNA mismatch endonuclease (patch repair protein)